MTEENMLENWTQSGLPPGALAGLFVCVCGIAGTKAKALYTQGDRLMSFRLLRYCVWLFILWFWAMLVGDLNIWFLTLTSHLAFVLVSIVLLTKSLRMQTS
jgi:hypothetical protein